jgi:hypothetical protein
MSDVLARLQDLETTWTEDFIDDGEGSELAAEFRRVSEQARIELEADLARQFQVQGDDEETAGIRAAWYVWRLGELMTECVLYGKCGQNQDAR